MLKIRDVQWSDLEEISKLDLMDDDLMELEGMNAGEDVGVTLTVSCVSSMSRICRCFYEDTTNEIIGVYGVTNQDVIWFLSSKKILSHWKEFVRGTKEEFKFLTKNVTYAFNYVHHNHKRALNWLRWLGFYRTIEQFHFPPQKEKYYKLEFKKE